MEQKNLRNSKSRNFQKVFYETDIIDGWSIQPGDIFLGWACNRGFKIGPNPSMKILYVVNGREGLFMTRSYSKAETFVSDRRKIF